MKNKLKRLWARDFTGTIRDFITQATTMGLTQKSIKYWVMFNWNIKI